MSSPIPSFSRPALTHSSPTWPLTTIFTPPASCDFHFVPWDTCTEFRTAGTTFIACEAGTSGDCLPTSFNTRLLTPTFSPGVCPSGHSVAGTSGTIGLATTLFCCPSGLTFGSIYANHYFNVCYATLTAADGPTIQPIPTLGSFGSDIVDIVGSYSTTGYSVADRPDSPTSTGDAVDLSSNPTFVFGYQSALVMMWVSSDLPNFDPESAPVLSASPISTRPVTSTPATRPRQTAPASSPASSRENSAISPGQQAGIAVGVAILLLCIIAGAWKLLRRRNRHHRADKRPYIDSKPELPGDHVDQKHADSTPVIVGARSPVEIGAHERHELDGVFRGNEARSTASSPTY